MAPTAIEKSKISRSILINRFQELATIVEEASLDSTKLSQFKVRYPSVDPWLKEFERCHTIIVNNLESPEEISAEDEIRAEVDSLYFSIKLHYDNLIAPVVNSNSPSTTTVPNVKLPRINLPYFDDKLSDWQGFIDLFNSLIHQNASISEIEKFQYLSSALSKDPLAIIRTIPLSASNYNIAYQALVNRYQNKRLLATDYWNAIHHFPPLHSENYRALRVLLDTFSENITALKHLNLPTDSWDFVLFQILFSKIDSNSRKRFELQYTSSDIPKYTELKAFLEHQYKALEACVSTDRTLELQTASRPISYSHKPPINHNFGKNSAPSSSFVASTDRTSTENCLVCNSRHIVSRCPVFLSKTPKDRFDLVKEHNLCLNCLGTSHRLARCPSKYKCQQCRSKHHTLLHFPNLTSSTEVSTLLAVVEPIEPETIASPSTPSVVLTNNILSQTSILLSTAVVEIIDGTGNYRPIRLLVDTGSQASFITLACQRKLGLKSLKSSFPISGLGQMTGVASNGIATCKIRPVGFPDVTFVVEAIILKSICANMPANPFDISRWKHLSNLKLADPHFNKPGPVDMLIGADLFPHILKQSRVCGNASEPVAIDTVLGYILMGKVSQTSTSLLNSFFVSANNSLDDSLTRFWQTEEIPNPVNDLSPDDSRCETLYSSTISRQPSGRYIVELPFKHTPPAFVDSRALERRLLRDATIRSLYTEFMQDYLDQAHMQLVPNVSKEANAYYIPHHCVLKPHSTTTQLRVVFDASAQTPQAGALNEHLLTGAKLQKDIVAVLLHFRLHHIVFTADIKQMYRQILVSPQHRDFQGILWRSSPEHPIQEYWLNTVTYGVASAPFLALRTIIQLASDEGHRFPLAAHILKNDIYVDDIVSGCDSLDKAVLAKQQLISILESGGFQLRKWASNSSQFLSDIPTTHQAVSFDSSDPPTLKILGLQWLPRDDVFMHQINSSQTSCQNGTYYPI